MKRISAITLWVCTVCVAALLAVWPTINGNVCRSSMETLRKYVVSYEPCGSANKVCMGFPRTPDDVAAALKCHDMDGTARLYVTLMLLKTYRAHVENYHQSYEMRNVETLYDAFSYDIMLAVFSKFSGVNLREEFLSSDIGYKWILTQPALLKNPLIFSEVIRIQQGLADIERD